MSKQLKAFASECQIEADRMAYKIVTERKSRAIYDSCQNYCDFNLWHSFGVIGWYKDVVLFVAKNGEQLKRKFSLTEFIDFAIKFRIKSLGHEIKDFEHFKRIKVKTIKGKDMKKYKKIKSKKNYDLLLKSGMFFEFYPELSGEWEKDKITIKGKEL